MFHHVWSIQQEEINDPYEWMDGKTYGQTAREHKKYIPVKRDINAFMKSTYPYQSAQSRQASIGKNFSLYLTHYSVYTHFNTPTADSFAKILREKKKLLTTSNFFFSHNVFYSIRKLYPHLSIF